MDRGIAREEMEKDSDKGVVVIEGVGTCRAMGRIAGNSKWVEEVHKMDGGWRGSPCQLRSPRVADRTVECTLGHHWLI